MTPITVFPEKGVFRDDDHRAKIWIEFPFLNPVFRGLKIPTKVGKMKEVDMPLSGKEMKRLFEKNGWVFLRQTGSHAWMQKKTELRQYSDA